LKFFNHISVKRKLALMLMMPIIALLFFVVIKIVEKAHSLEELHALQGLSSLAVKIDALTHEMQKERALSSGFIGSWQTLALADGPHSGIFGTFRFSQKGLLKFLFPPRTFMIQLPLLGS